MEDCADKRLNEKQLSEERKREIEADQLEPVCKQREKIKSCVIGVVEERGNQTHCRAHQRGGCRDDCGFKQNRVRFFGMKQACGSLEVGIMKIPFCNKKRHRSAAVIRVPIHSYRNQIYAPCATCVVFVFDSIMIRLSEINPDEPRAYPAQRREQQADDRRTACRSRAFQQLPSTTDPCQQRGAYP